VAERNIEIVRRIHQTWGREGSPVPSGLLHPEIEWVNPPDAIETGVRHGVEEFERAAQRVEETFRPRLELERISAAGEDEVVVIAVLHGRGTGSGLEVARRQGYVWTIRAGQAIRFQWFNDPREALEVAGLAEEPNPATRRESR
jgi:ketosteroid isomerase-like protein